MMNCKEYSFLVEKKRDEKLPFKEKVNVFIHGMMCKYCKIYKKQSDFINSKLKGLMSSYTPKKLSDSQIDKINKSIIEESNS